MSEQVGVKSTMPTSTSKRQHSGRLPTAGTVVAEVMARRKIRAWELSAAIKCSGKSLYNYLSLTLPFPAKKLNLLCDFLDMEPDELLDLDTMFLKVYPKKQEG